VSLSGSPRPSGRPLLNSPELTDRLRVDEKQSAHHRESGAVQVLPRRPHPDATPHADLPQKRERSIKR
jgi:hypothetical protein